MWAVIGWMACGRSPEIVALEVVDGPVLAGSAARVRAEVAEPDGAQDLVSGTVEVRGREVARFAADGVAGTFVAEVPGGELLAGADEDAQVVVRAVFVDTDGHRAERAHRIALSCGADAWCGGRCVDLESDPDHCGACGDGCDGRCDAGECEAAPEPLRPGWSPCAQEDGRTVDCDAVCGAGGLACASDCDPREPYFAEYGFSDSFCDGLGVTHHRIFDGGDCRAQTGEEGPVWFRCCCGDPR